MLLNYVALCAFTSNGGRGRPVLGLAAMLAPLLGYFFCMIAVLTAVVGVVVGLSNTSTSERVRHYPRAVVERNVAATPTEPRLFMVVPERLSAVVADDKVGVQFFDGPWWSGCWRMLRSSNPKYRDHHQNKNIKHKSAWA
jgi:hypothetical protein